MAEIRYLKSQDVAKLLGVKTGTLAKWRTKGQGPAGHFAISDSCVLYPTEEVERFIAEKRAASEATKDRVRSHLAEVAHR